jgi:hypothetical protein
MHMARRAVAWAEWAEWTCKSDIAGETRRSRLQSKRAGFGPLSFFGAPTANPLISRVSCCEAAIQSDIGRECQRVIAPQHGNHLVERGNREAGFVGDVSNVEAR